MKKELSPSYSRPVRTFLSTSLQHQACVKIPHNLLLLCVNLHTSGGQPARRGGEAAPADVRPALPLAKRGLLRGFPVSSAACPRGRRAPGSAPASYRRRRAHPAHLERQPTQYFALFVSWWRPRSRASARCGLVPHDRGVVIFPRRPQRHVGSAVRGAPPHLPAGDCRHAPGQPPLARPGNSWRVTGPELANWLRGVF